MAKPLPIDCRACAYAGDLPQSPDSDEWVYCYRKRAATSAGGRCGQGMPVKAASGRLRRRKGRDAQV